MKKHFLLLLILFWAFNLSFAQTYLMKENNYRHISVTFTPSQPEVQTIKNDYGTFTRLLMEDCTPSREVSKPELPLINKLVEIPLCDDVIIMVKDSRYQDFDAAQMRFTGVLYPAQQSYPKSYTGPVSFDKDETVYQTNAFYRLPLASIEKAGVMRDINMANITISPVAYNPVTQKVRVYNYIDVEITFVNANIRGTQQMKSKYGSPLFKTAQKSVINPMNTTRSEIEAAPIKYLIVAHSMFEGNTKLQEFVNWKKRMGYLVEIAYTNNPDVGSTTTSIRNFIKSHYENATITNPAPTFLLLVGDIEQIPAFNCDGAFVSDNYYAEWTGDYLPDCYHGRFSAQDISQLTPQIDKTLMYEQYTMPDPSYLGKAIVIAGYDPTLSPTYANGQLHYISENYLNTNNGYSQVFVHPYDCRDEANTIRNEIGAGLGWGNYSAHGLEDGWLSPAFNNSHIEGMNNEGKYGVLIGNCCLSGKFDEDNCFGEALLRAEHKGTMGYIGASSSSYWDEDYYWAVGLRNEITATPTYDANHLGAYDRMFHLHNEAHSDWYTTMGGMIHAGNLAVQASSSERKQYYWEVYHVFGDPSVKLYQSMPDAMIVNSADVLNIGKYSYSVTAVPYAYVALTHNNELIAATFADGSGHADLTFDPLSNPGEYELAVSAQNYIQYFKTVNVVAQEGSYVVANNINMTNATPTPEATIQWDIILKNFGVQAASGVSAEISTEYAGVTITQNTVSVGTLAANGSTTIPNAFSAILPVDASDHDTIPFTVTVHYDGNINTHSTKVVVIAPKLPATNTSQNSAIHAGDAITVNITNFNNGHYKLETGTAELVSLYSGVTVMTEPQDIINLEKNQSISTAYNLQISNTIQNITIVPLSYSVYRNDNLILRDTFHITIGDTIETWENDFNTFHWDNDNKYPWQIVSNEAHSGSHCARSYKKLPNSKTSTLEITLASNTDGIFSYYHKVSSEENDDIFTFSIDNEEKEALPGHKPWTKSEFFVSAGTHTYKFSYSKTEYWTDGSDCIWIDDIVFPGLGTLATDQVVTLEPEVVSACESFTWHGTTYTESGTHTFLRQGENGEKDTMGMLHLTINQPVTLEPEVVSACESYNWHNVDYDESGTKTFIRPGIDGECDTTETLKLTINQPSTYEFTKTACESFTWNNQTYTESSDYQQTFENSNGCDSIVTLHLIINHASQPTEFNVTANNSYNWNGHNYTQSNDYIQTLTNVHGCDSIVTLHLTITNASQTTEVSETACETFTWNNETYTQSGDYVQTLHDVNGSDSVVILHLTIYPIYNYANDSNFKPDTIVSCGEIVSLNGQEITTNGTYNITYQSIHSCDSIVQKQVIFNKHLSNEQFNIDCPSSVSRTLNYGDCNYTFTEEELGVPTVTHFLENYYALRGEMMTVTYSPNPAVFNLGEHTITWTATDPCGNTTTCEQTVEVVQPVCSEVTDIEGNVYPTKWIDCDCWMTKNLSSKSYDNVMTRSATKANPNAYTYVSAAYPDASANESTLGNLYTWQVAIGTGNLAASDANGKVQGICPQGWCLPTVEQYARLSQHGRDALRSNAYWIDGGGNNATGFSVLPAGYYDNNIGDFRGLGAEARFWSTSMIDGVVHPYKLSFLYYCSETIMKEATTEELNTGYSIRCVKKPIE